MAVRNAEIASILYHLADLMEIEGASGFRVRAYRTAAENIERLPISAAEMVEGGEPLTKIRGVGPSIAEKVAEIIKTGKLGQLETAQERTPRHMRELLRIQGLGPRRVQQLYKSLGVKSIKELRKAAEQGHLRDIHGFGEKIEKGILESLKKNEQVEQRFRIDKAEGMVDPILAKLAQSGLVGQIEVAGSFRRRRETVGDLDILCISPKGAEVIDNFAEHAGVREVLSQGETRSTVILGSGLQVDLRVVERGSYGAALLYFTGSKAHNIHLRAIAQERGWKINEYGVFDETGRRLAGETEESIYRLFDMPWIPPEMREDSGEIEAALKRRLPQLLTIEDLRGDLQSHTRASDGKANLETMARRARALGREYLAVTDHSRSLHVAGGMDVEAVSRQIDAIDRMNEQWDDFRLLKSSEVDILADGSLDFPDDLLSRLDIVVISIHSHFRRSPEQQTERILRAMDNPYAHILAHPTGRLLGRRDPYEIDLERVLEGAKERGVFLEVNAHPERLDLKDTYIRLAKEVGVKLAISTDAHTPSELAYLRYGVEQARRGWLTADDVINTRPWIALKKMLRR